MRTAVVILALATATAGFCDEAQSTAKRYFREANTQFQLGHYAEAAKEFEAGYELDPRPGFLWNLAQCYRKLGDSEKALHFYKQYVLNAKPSRKHAANVEEAQQEIKVLEPLVAAQKKASAAPPDGVVGSDEEKESLSSGAGKDAPSSSPQPHAKSSVRPVTESPLGAPTAT